MSERTQFLLSRIEESGEEGIAKSELLCIMFVNGFGEPRLTEKYLTYLVGFGKVREEGDRFYSSRCAVTESQSAPQVAEDSVIHTHASDQEGQP